MLSQLLCMGFGIEWDPVCDQMMDHCYWDYLRVYVPQGSQLLGPHVFPCRQTLLGISWVHW